MNYNSLNKNTISFKLHNRTEKIIIINRVQLLRGGGGGGGGGITILVHFFIQVLLTILVYKYCDHILAICVSCAKRRASSD